MKLAKHHQQPNNNGLVPSEYHQEGQLPAEMVGHVNSAAEETKHTTSANTLRSYSSAFRIFCEYCAQYGVSSLPADPMVVVAFLGYQKELLQQNGKQLSNSTMSTRLAAIRHFHIKAGYPTPCDHPAILEVMKGIQRNRERNTLVADQQPILNEEMELLLRHVESKSEGLIKYRDKALLLLARQGGFRRSELESLVVENLTFNRNSLKVDLPFSKTNQNGKKEWKELPRIESYSAYDAVKQWLDIANIDAGHVFRSTTRRGKRLRPYSGDIEITDQTPDYMTHANTESAVSYGYLKGNDIYRIIQQYAKAVGLNAKQFGAHSMRSGCVTQLHEDNRDSLYIMARTGHSDPRTLLHYLKPKALE